MYLGYDVLHCHVVCTFVLLYAQMNISLLKWLLPPLPPGSKKNWLGKLHTFLVLMTMMKKWEYPLKTLCQLVSLMLWYLD